MSSLQRSREYFTLFFPHGMKAREGMASHGSSEEPSIRERLAGALSRWNDFDLFVSSFKQYLLSFYVQNQKLLDISFKQKLHELYIYIARDESRVFVLLENDIISLLARLEVSNIPSDAITDHISVFECLLTASTNRYDDLTEKKTSVNADIDTQKITKYTGIFLINYFKHQRLPRDKIRMLGSFIYKLAQYYFTMTQLVDDWFVVSLSEPDVVYLLHKNKLSLNCFPIYELAKDFLFLGEDTFNLSRDTLLHIVLNSGFSTHLKNWILTSEFPGIISTGLLSSFNQLNYNEALLDGYKDDFDEYLTNSPAFEEFDKFVLFILDIIAYSTHDSVKSAFLNCFEKRFIDQVLETYNTDNTNHLNTVLLLSHAFRKLIFPQGPNGSQYIVDEFVEKYFGFNNLPAGSKIMKLFTSSLLESTENSVVVISTLKLFESFTKAKSLNLLSSTFSDDQTFVSSHSNLIIQSLDNYSDLTSKVRTIIDADPYYQDVIIDKLDESFTLLSKSLINDPNNIYAKQTWFQFSSSKPVPTLLLYLLLKFFSNSQETNRTLIQLMKNVIAAHGGRIFNFVLSDSGELDTTPFGLIFNYLWQSYTAYSNAINKGSKLIPAEIPDKETVKVFKEAHEGNLEEVVTRWLHAQQKTPYTFDNLALNIQIFQEFTLELYALHVSRNISLVVSL